MCPTKPVGIVQVNFLPIKLVNLGDIWMIEFIMHKSNDTGTAMLLMLVVIIQMSSSTFISQSKIASHIQFSNNQVSQGASTKTAKGAERQLSFSLGIGFISFHVNTVFASIPVCWSSCYCQIFFTAEIIQSCHGSQAFKQNTWKEKQEIFLIPDSFIDRFCTHYCWKTSQK